MPEVTDPAAAPPAADPHKGTVDPVALGLDITQDIKPGTKFRRGGFKPASEVIAEAAAAKAATAAGNPPVNDPAAATDPDIQAAIMSDPNIQIELPDGVTMGTPAEGDPPADPANPPAAAAAATGPKIRIGGKEFATQEEAWAYAEELQRQTDAADAFRQGIEAGQNLNPGNPPAAAAVPQPEVIELDPLDPDFKEKLRVQLTKLRGDIIQEVKQGAKQEANTTAMWDGFYRDNPDLAGARDIVGLVMEQEKKTLYPMDIQPALKLLAQKTREKLKPYVEAAMPRVTLPRTPPAVSPTGAPQVTAKAQPPKPLSFTDQLRQNRRNKGAAQVR